MKTWLVAVFLGSLLALGVMGCSSDSKRIEELSSSPATTESKPTDAIRVLDSGFFWDGETLSYAFTAENITDDTSMEGAIFQVTILDQAKEAVGGDMAIIDFILPGQVVAHAGHVPLGKEPKSLEISFTVDYQASVDRAKTFDSIAGSFEATSFGGRVVASIKSPFDQDLRRLRVVAVLRSADGAILNGGATSLEFLPARSESAVTIDVLGVLPEEPARIDVYTMFSAETVFRLE